jgi:hypothetical protein
MTTADIDPQHPTLLTIADFTAKHAWAKESTLRNLIDLAEVNGFKTCVYRLGRKILLDEACVFEYLKNSGGRS